jgi:hypothetical protein
MSNHSARFIIIDSQEHPLDLLPRQLGDACTEHGQCWAALAVAASLSTALSYTASAHAAGHAPMAIFLAAKSAAEVMPHIWQLDTHLCAVLCGSAEELASIDPSSLTGPWLTLRLPVVQQEALALCQKLRNDFTTLQTQQSLTVICTLPCSFMIRQWHRHCFATKTGAVSIPMPLFANCLATSPKTGSSKIFSSCHAQVYCQRCLVLTLELR